MPASELLVQPEGHHYPSFIIQLSIEMVLHAHSSQRGSQKIFELFSQFISIKTPSFYSIRKWIYRFGLYVLQQKVEFRQDWIFLFDHTIELGQTKCLVILGIPMGKLAETGFNLKHQDMQVLNIEIMTHSTGAVICQKLEALSTRVGEPVQILSDHGPDLKKGTELFMQKHPGVIYTYDVTHKLACLVKAELENDERWGAFVELCTKSTKLVQQTELLFLAPRNQRTKSRYMNITELVTWAKNLLSYQQAGDFSKINPAFVLEQEHFHALEGALGSETMSPLSALVSNVHADENSFRDEMIRCAGERKLGEVGQLVLETANTGRRRFMEKFGWLHEYQDDISRYSQLVQLTTMVEKQVKHEGLSQESKQVFEKNTKDLQLESVMLQGFKENISQFLLEEGSKAPKNHSLLATTDTLESVFGKYKLFSAKSPMKEVGNAILTIPAFITKKSINIVTKAMETIQGSDVEKWSNNMFGQSMFAKRIEAFKGEKVTRKVHEKYFSETG